MRTEEKFIIAGIIGISLFLILMISLEFIWEGYNPISQTISELGAENSPFRHIMNYIGFSTLGIAIMVFALGFKDEFKKNLYTEISFYCLMVSGFFIFLIGFFPCDINCVNLSLKSKFHIYVSAIPGLLVPISAIVSSSEISKEFGRLWGNLVLYMAILGILSGPLMFITIFTSYSGFIERMSIFFSVIWIFGLSIKFFIKKYSQVLINKY